MYIYALLHIERARERDRDRQPRLNSTALVRGHLELQFPGLGLAEYSNTLIKPKKTQTV